MHKESFNKMGQVKVAVLDAILSLGYEFVAFRISNDSLLMSHDAVQIFDEVV
jgi:hypothetical protein